jgi:hypothetical protein
VYRIVDRPVLRRSAVRLALVLTLAGIAAVALAAVAPRVENPHGKFKEDCQLCHSAKSWKEVRVSPRFDHSKYGFALTGAHATSDCMRCHTSLEFSQSKTECASCHQDPHRGEMAPTPAATARAAHGPRARSALRARFPLSGGHAAVDCEAATGRRAGQMQFKGTLRSAAAATADTRRYAARPRRERLHDPPGCH